MKPAYTLIILFASAAASAAASAVFAETTTTINTNTACTTTCTRNVSGGDAPKPMASAFGLPATVYTVDAKAPSAAPVPTTAAPTTNVKEGDGPDEVSTTGLTDAHKQLQGNDLLVWNKFCEGRDPKAVGDWRYRRCSGLDSDFKK